MALGDVTLTYYGTYDRSGAAMLGTGLSMNLGGAWTSGSKLIMVPCADGHSISVYKQAVEGWS